MNNQPEVLLDTAHRFFFLFLVAAAGILIMGFLLWQWGVGWGWVFFWTFCIPPFGTVTVVSLIIAVRASLNARFYSRLELMQALAAGYP